MFGPDGLPLLHGRENIPLPENVGDLGMMMSALLDLEGKPRLNIEATGIYSQGLTPKPHIFRGAADSLLQLHNDWLVKEFIYRNLDVDSMAEYLSTSAKGRELLEFLRTGKMRRGEVTLPKDAKTGVSIVDRYIEIRARLAQVEKGMCEL